MWGKVGSRMTSFSSHGSHNILTLGSMRDGLLVSSHTDQCHCYTPWRNHCLWEPWGSVLSTILGYIRWDMVFLLPILLLKFLAEYVACELKFLFLMHLVGWRLHFPQFSTCWKIFLIFCSLVKDWIRDVLVGWVLKGLPSLHLTLWLLRETFCRQGFFSSVCLALEGEN